MNVRRYYTVRGLAVAGFGVNSSREKSRIQVIALAGVATELSVIMLVFLEICWRQHIKRAQEEGRKTNSDDLHQAIIEGGALRVRPKVMTASAIIIGLLPIMYGSGTGSEVMSRIAAPMVGGMLSALVLTLLVLPAVYLLWKRATID